MTSLPAISVLPAHHLLTSILKENLLPGKTQCVPMAVSQPTSRGSTPCREDGDPTHTCIVAAWLSPCTGNSWGRVAGLGKAVVLFSAISLVGVAVRKQGMILLTHKYFPDTSAKERTKAEVEISYAEVKPNHECPVWKQAGDMQAIVIKHLTYLT